MMNPGDLFKPIEESTPRGVSVRCGGIRWRVHISGSGPALLLLHGTGASNQSFRELVPLLAHRFTVVAPDLPGHGFSEAPASFTPSLPATAVALGELLRALSLPPPAVAVGHSAGAAVVARMALDETISPDLLVGIGAALVPFHGLARAVFPATARLLAATAKWVPIRVRRSITVERALESTGSHVDQRSVDLYGRLWGQPTHVAAVLSMMANWDLDPLFADLPHLDAPFLLLAGEGDRAVPTLQQREVAERLPKARIVTIAGAGHLLHEERPAIVARHILAALESVRAGDFLSTTPGSSS